MKRLLLKRISSSPYVTQGVLIDGCTGLPILLTLENPWVENIPDKSCVPTGVYICKPYTSSKYRDVFEVTNVTGRSYILFHIGNTEKDTRGCILPGLRFGFIENNIPAVLESATAMDLLKNHIGKNEFILDIT